MIARPASWFVVLSASDACRVDAGTRLMVHASAAGCRQALDNVRASGP
jgi:hypothetical protein